MGHIAHLRNQFKSPNTFECRYDYIYYKIGAVVHEKIFKWCEGTFAIFFIISQCKMAWPFYLN